MANKKVRLKPGQTDVTEDARENHPTQRGYQHRPTRYKAAEDFPQWKSAEEEFDLQQYMQEIM